MNGISILMYHQVGDFQRVKTHRAVYCHQRRFAAQMALLKRLGCSVLTMDEVQACLAGERAVPPRAVAITFDDGYENFYEVALPQLQRHGFPATVYVVAGLVGGCADWLPADGLPAAPLMGAERLREVRRAGIQIGSHAMSHVPLAGLAAGALAAELADSRRVLEDLLGEPIRHLCYPYGSHNLAVVEATAAAGYATGVTCQRARATATFDPLALPRKAISLGDDLLGFLWKVQFKHRPKGVAVRRRGLGAAPTTP
ncbi:polysaccharide deacetylase family protein [uncultured Thiodictyon sp.]|uniref:polysaccharide deacetylase family protein n=1 Tax=uncultured Thiodictyon sp. TaxID=1846217 RepID=UPI0025CC3DC4|nr:polysaccharide deacetylase family protein [uncultured Thiodictyon sp.]